MYKVYASPKSYNSQLTVPLSLLLSDGDEDFLILEMGVSEPNNMRDLLSIVEPEIAIITHIADQHTMHFSNEGIRGIVEEKAVFYIKAVFSFSLRTLHGILILSSNLLFQRNSRLLFMTRLRIFIINFLVRIT